MLTVQQWGEKKWKRVDTMWGVKRANLRGIPAAVWALLLMALLSFAVFNCQQDLEMSSFRRILPLKECVVEAGYRLSAGYLRIERSARTGQGVGTQSGLSYIEQARGTIQTGITLLQHPGGKNGTAREGHGMDLRDGFAALDDLLRSFAELARERMEMPGAPGKELEARQNAIYERAELMMDDILTELKLRGEVLQKRQRQLKTLLNLGWVMFAVVLCLLIIRIEYRGREWEKALARSEARLRSMFTVFPDPALVVDRNGMILEVPSPSKELLPGAANALTGRRVSEIVGGQAITSAVELINEAIETGKMVTVDYEQEVHGVKKYFEGRIMPIPDSTPAQALWLAHDLTKFRESQDRRIELERRIQQANKLESLGVMAGGIAHDFDNLLTGIMGQAEIVMSNIDPSSAMYDSLREIQKAASRAAELAGQMLKYSGHTHLAFTTINVADLIRNAIADLRGAIPAGIELSIEVCDSPQFEGDYKQIYQIVRNLALNAVEAIGDRHGSITLSAETCSCTQRDLRDNYLKESHPPGDYVRICIEDDGCGISTGNYARLFDPFFTTKFTGRGLGLAAVQGIVRSHCGIIRVRSARDCGTRFEVLFPVYKRDRATDETVGRDSLPD